MRAPIVLCGVGIGDFFDGIVFHQILQTHHMRSNTGSDRNHHLLAIHHVIDAIDGTAQQVADVAFLAAGVVMIATGSQLAHFSTSDSEQQ